MYKLDLIFFKINILIMYYNCVNMQQLVSYNKYKGLFHVNKLNYKSLYCKSGKGFGKPRIVIFSFYMKKLSMFNGKGIR